MFLLVFKPTDSQSYQQSFKELCSAKFSTDVNLTETARVDRQTDNKYQSVLDCIDDVLLEIQSYTKVGNFIRS